MRGNLRDSCDYVFNILVGHSMAGLALQLCWRVSPDVDSLLANVVPPTTEANIAFLQLLMSKKDTAGAIKVWQRLVGLRQPFDSRHLFEYVKFLIADRQVEPARLAWHGFLSTESKLFETCSSSSSSLWGKKTSR